MKKIIIIALILLFNPVHSLAVNISDTLSVEGTYLGVFNAIETRQTQFDFATNIDFNYTISDEMNGIVQFQGGNGGGTLGFVGPGIEVTDISLEYTPKTLKHHYIVDSNIFLSK